MAEPILQVDGLTKRFGAVVASDNLDLAVAAGTIHALIGPNGAGKSTAIAQIAGELAPDAGRVRFAGRDVTDLPLHARARLGLARSYQITSVFPGFTAEDNVAMAVQARDAHSFRFWRPARRDKALRTPARQCLERVGLGGRGDIQAGTLAHGEQRQLELAMVLAIEPAMMLLDEPMAGMSQEETRRMTEVIRPLAGHMTILLVEHDMDVVFDLAERITVLVGGRAIATGTPHDIRANPAVRDAYLGGDA